MKFYQMPLTTKIEGSQLHICQFMACWKSLKNVFYRALEQLWPAYLHIKTHQIFQILFNHTFYDLSYFMIY